MNRAETERCIGHARSAPNLASLDEAEAYLRHPVLGPRLVECGELVLAIEGRSAGRIFGSPDDLKFHSCMTLFASVRDAAPVFTMAPAKYFAGTPDRPTTELLKANGPRHEV